MDEKLSEHFSLAELTASETAARHGWDNSPPPEALMNLGRLVVLLESIRDLLGRPIHINSGYRSKEVNDAVGSKDTSQHRLGCAADISIADMVPDEVIRAILRSGLPFDQVIREFDSWTHVSVPNAAGAAPRGVALIIDQQGTRIYA